MTEPLLYKADYEVIAADEPQTEQGLIDTLSRIQNKVYDDSHQAFRAVHAKCHGIVTGELIVPDSLPSNYAQGLFAQGGRYPVICRCRGDWL
jgi:hypothetical protein